MRSAMRWKNRPGLTAPSAGVEGGPQALEREAQSLWFLCKITL